MDGRLTRAEGVASDKDLLSGEFYESFGIVAVCLPRLTVPLIAELRDVDDGGAQRGRELRVEAVAVHQRSAGVFEGASGTTVLESLPGEALRIVSGGELIAIADIPIALAQIHVLIESAVVIVNAGREIVHRCGLSGTDRRGQRYQNGIAGDVALSVVIKEEE